MTEAEWLAGTQTSPMLKCLRGQASQRKRRLLAAACCRRNLDFLPNEQCRRAVEVAEW